MRNRAVSFTSLLAVIGVSIVFGMVLGGRLNTPRVALAAPAALHSAGPVRLAPAATADGGPRDFADVVEQSMPSVVSVTARDNGGNGEEEPRGRQELFEFFFGPEGPDMRDRDPMPRIGEGTGFVISSDGYILTNYHVVEEAEQVKVGFADGNEAPADVVGTDPSIDLALLKVSLNGLTALPLGDSGSLRVGEWVIAIGNPLNYEQTVTVGVVSAKRRRVPVGTTDRGGLVTFLQTDAAINFGNSGGPLLDINGNVVGINTAITRNNFAEGIGFALPINQARRVIEQLRDHGYVRRGYIGIAMNLAGIDRDAQDYYGLPDRRGVIVDEVNDDSPADKAGLRKDDIIRKVDGEYVEDNDDLIATISARMPGDSVALEVYREGRTVKLTATLTERPLNVGQPARQQTTPPDEEEPIESKGLGITVENINSRWRERLALGEEVHGVVVTDVEFDSQAADKNMGRGLIVTHINDVRIRSVSDWEETVAELSSGAPVKVDALIPGPGGAGRPTTYFLRAP